WDFSLDKQSAVARAQALRLRIRRTSETAGEDAVLPVESPAGKPARIPPRTIFPIRGCARPAPGRPPPAAFRCTADCACKRTVLPWQAAGSLPDTRRPRRAPPDHTMTPAGPA